MVFWYKLFPRAENYGDGRGKQALAVTAVLTAGMTALMVGMAEELTFRCLSGI